MSLRTRSLRQPLGSAGLLALLSLALAPLPSAAQARTQPYADTLRALVVLVQFLDDDAESDPPDLQGWPMGHASANTLPPFTQHLLAPTPQPPFNDSSLTAYFFQQSQGRLLIYGEVHPAIYVPDHPNSYYYRPRGFGYLTREVLEHLDQEGYDFRQYDQNADGQLDQLFVIVRSDSLREVRQIGWTGISCLHAACGGGPLGGAPREDLVFDGVRVDWNRSGAILLHRTPGNLLPHFYHVRLMAHELGHDLWAPFFNHVHSLRQNDVPAQVAGKSSTNHLGYLLMAGVGGGRDVRGSDPISAFERHLLGWIDCPLLDAPQQGLVLRDLYTTSDCYRLALGPRTLFLSNLQRLGPFDPLRRGGRQGEYEMGLLRTTGLLAMLTEGTRVDVLPADNTLQLSIHNADYRGDLWHPQTQRQLSPWTRPNINGFTQYPADYNPHWAAVDHIRTTPTDTTTLRFDFWPDFRENPVIQADSWMGAETTGYVFSAPIRIEPGVTLFLSTAITASSGVHVAPGGRLVVEAQGHLHLGEQGLLLVAPGATVVVSSSASLDGRVWLDPGSSWQVRDDSPAQE